MTAADLPWTWKQLKDYILGADVTEQAQLDEFTLQCHQGLREFHTKLSHHRQYERKYTFLTQPPTAATFDGSYDWAATFGSDFGRIELMYQADTHERIDVVPDQQRVYYRSLLQGDDPPVGTPRYWDYYETDFFLYPLAEKVMEIYVEGWRIPDFSVDVTDDVTWIDLPRSYHQILANYIRGLRYASQEDWTQASQWMNLASSAFDTQREENEGHLQQATDIIHIGGRPGARGVRMDLPIQ